ncbi:MAG TPA: glycosyltransferase family 39 protein [Candidatus Kapabacteria bacterium]|nr:glycosyltransferase family 39 protein [Candidatus Kapabacteria bacterium]
MKDYNPHKPILILLTVYIALQIIIVVFTEPHFESDSAYYYQKALQCVEYNSFYPNHSNTNDEFIIAPIYINYLFIILKIFKSVKAILFFNIILNTVNLILLYSITNRIFSNKAALISAILYVLYLNNLGIILMNFTDLLFLTTILIGIYLFFINTQWAFALAGVMIALSIGIRPIGWALFVAILIIIIFKIKQFQFAKLSLFLTGFLLVIMSVGLYNKQNFGDFIYSGTTGSLNLLIGANDDATGAFEPAVFDEGKIGYLPHPEQMSYKEKNEFYQHQALYWIKTHPIKWLSLLPVKFIHLFITDDFALYPLVSTNQIYVYQYGKALLKDHNFQSLISQPYRIEYLILAIIHHIFYAIILFFFFYQFYFNFKHNRKNPTVLLIEIFIILGLLMTIPIYGAARYKYPYIILGMILSAPIIEKKILRSK